jgi:hypothetical protein
LSTRPGHLAAREPTAAAGQVIDQYLLEQRSRILREASRNQAESADRVGVEEVRLAITRLNTADRLIPGSSFDVIATLIRRPRFLRFILWVAIALATSTIAVVIAFSSPTTAGSSSVNILTSLSAGIAGALAATAVILITEFISVRQRQRWHETASASRDFVRTMSKLEAVAEAVANQLSPAENQARYGIREILAIIGDAGVWSSNDVAAYLRLLSMRNAVVHEDALSIPRSELAFALSEPARLTDPLHRWLEQDNGNEHGLLIKG